MSQPHSPVWQLGIASADFAVCAANMLSFRTTRPLSHAGHATFVSDRIRRSKELLHSLHSYSKIGMTYSRRASRSSRQKTRILLYSPSPSLTVSMSP
jgi:hypothetical protein